jgi:hypothetical protein
MSLWGPGRVVGQWVGSPCGVDGELAKEFAGGRVDDADVQVLDKQDDDGSGVGSPDADVAEPTGDAQRDAPGFVDAVSADPVVGVGAAVAARSGFGQRGVDGGGRCAVRQGPVRAVVVVGLDELIEQGLQLGEGGGLSGLGADPLLEGLLEPFDFALGLRMVGLAVLLRDVAFS